MIEYQNKFGTEVEVSKIIVDYTQSGDCTEDIDKYQTLRLETCDGGGGPFLRMSFVDCDHFSINSLYDLYLIIKDFESKIKYPDGIDYIEFNKINNDEKNNIHK